MRDLLLAACGRPYPVPLRPPPGQLAKSLISGQTRDAVSRQAYDRLIIGYPRWDVLAAASPDAVRKVIADVTFADRKAEQLVQAFRIIAADHPDFDLGFLAGWPVDRALAWLEDLPGVGRKVSASTLNFSTLAMPAFVIDRHVLRILQCCGFVPAAASNARRAYDIVMPALDEWTSAELAELHVLLKRLGQVICRPIRPDCLACPLSRLCKSAFRIDAPTARHAGGRVALPMTHSAPWNEAAPSTCELKSSTFSVCGWSEFS
jgi:endonuclease-3